MWILKLKSVDSEVKSVDSEAKKCRFVKKNSHFFYCLLLKVWFECRRNHEKVWIRESENTRPKAE